MVHGRVMILARHVQRGEDPVHVAVIVIERQRDLQLRGHLFEGGVAIRAPLINPRLAQYACFPGVSVSIVRVEREGAVEQALRLRVILPHRAMVQHLGGQHALISRHVVGRLALRTVVRGCLDAAGQRRDDRAGHLVLDGEDILELAVIAFGPNVPVGFRIDQLHGDADSITHLPHAPLEDVIDAEFARDLLHFYRLTLVYEGRVTRDNEQVMETGQLRYDVLCEAVREEFLLRIAAHVNQRQHGDGRLLGDRRRQPSILRVLRRSFWLLLKPDPKDADRTGDILDALVAEILEFDVVQSLADLIAHGARNTDAARLGEHFQPRRDVDAVAQDVVFLNDHVAQIDADAELHPPRRRDVGVASCHPALNLGGAQHRIGDAIRIGVYSHRLNARARLHVYPFHPRRPGCDSEYPKASDFT